MKFTDIEEITPAYESIFYNRSSINKGLNYLPLGAVIDEEKSVRWNREEVERLNKETEATLAERKALQNQKETEFWDALFDFVSREVGCDTVTASKFLREMSNHGWCEIDEIVDFLDTWIDCNMILKGDK